MKSLILSTLALIISLSTAFYISKRSKEQKKSLDKRIDILKGTYCTSDTMKYQGALNYIDTTLAPFEDIIKKGIKESISDGSLFYAAGINNTEYLITFKITKTDTIIYMFTKEL